MVVYLVVSKYASLKLGIFFLHVCHKIVAVLQISLLFSADSMPVWKGTVPGGPYCLFWHDILVLFLFWAQEKNCKIRPSVVRKISWISSIGRKTINHKIRQSVSKNKSSILLFVVTKKKKKSHNLWNSRGEIHKNCQWISR